MGSKWILAAAVILAYQGATAGETVLETKARCQVLSIFKTHAPLGHIVPTDEFLIEFPERTTRVVQTMTGPHTVYFGSGLIQLERQASYHDRLGRVTKAPLKLTVEVTALGSDTKQLVLSIEAFNPFTGAMDVLASGSTDFERVESSFLYFHPVFSSPEITSAKPGDLIQSSIQCEFRS